MPTISIFLRKDDLPKWQAIENKSEWMSKRLNEKGAREPISQPKPKTGLESLTINKIEASEPVVPLYRNEKKGKI